ncbi:MAG: ABC transporter permease [Firmicutes bacterium]|nr:ABC transporter permease [Bacillota bacterium]
MQRIFVVAGKEFNEAWKNHIFLMIAALFFVFSLLSVYIGSTTKHAEIQAYLQTISLLKAGGATVFPPQPAIFTLTILQNNIIYVSMVGALVAIFLGFDVFTKEKEQGNLRLILSRPIFRDQLITGKILGGAWAIGLLQALIFVFGLVLLKFIGGITPTAGEVLRLVTFTLISFLYMLLFYFFALFISVLAKSSEVVFLVGITFWVAVSFVIPQLAETQKSYAYSTNVAAQSVTQIPQDTAISKAIELFSPTVHFQHLGNNLLQVIPETAKLSTGSLVVGMFPDLVYLLAPLLIFLFLCYWSVFRIEVGADA